MKTEAQIEEINVRVETARAAYAAATAVTHVVAAYAEAVAAATLVSARAAHNAYAAAARTAYDATRKTNMTKEQLEEILAKVWMRDWSADDAADAIWGETFSDTTPPAPLTPPPTQK